MHQILKEAMIDGHLRDLKEKTAAIDVMVWLYKGAFACAYELGRGEPTLNFLQYPLKMLALLKSHKIKLICVFDGFHLKAKQNTEKDRFEFKLKNRLEAEKADAMGDKEKATRLYSRSLVLRQKMVDLFMDILHECNVEFVVAPYEADAQMSYMVKQGIADFAISEDSDLIAYGCPKIVMKLDFFGNAKIFDFLHFKKFSATDKGLKVL